VDGRGRRAAGVCRLQMDRAAVLPTGKEPGMAGRLTPIAGGGSVAGGVRPALHRQRSAGHFTRGTSPAELLRGTSPQVHTPPAALLGAQPLRGCRGLRTPGTLSRSLEVSVPPVPEIYENFCQSQKRSGQSGYEEEFLAPVCFLFWAHLARHESPSWAARTSGLHRRQIPP